MSDGRYTHRTDLTPGSSPILYDQGQQQAQLALERYHTLCAAVQKRYQQSTVPPDFTKGWLFERAGLLFSQYRAYSLEPILGVKLHPRPDGTIHPKDLQIYARGFRDDWKCSEGGILYCIGESREFWNMILNYHSVSGTTGIKAWDKLFGRLKRNNYDKAIIPCMVRIP